MYPNLATSSFGWLLDHLPHKSENVMFSSLSLMFKLRAISKLRDVFISFLDVQGLFSLTSEGSNFRFVFLDVQRFKFYWTPSHLELESNFYQNSNSVLILKPALNQTSSLVPLTFNAKIEGLVPTQFQNRPFLNWF